MTASFRDCARATHQLFDAVQQLSKSAALLEVPPLDGREWFELLQRKLVPQLTDDAYLVVAVVGGTNIGKSVIFNHLAGERASSTSPMASGTKHPVCLIPEGFVGSNPLSEIFPGFTLTDWSATGALEEDAEHRLYWRASSVIPSNLLVLDTPDIDSDAPVNWKRADNIRQAADVLVAVLTQQKYNDAAVKHFFRTAASEDKAIIVVFNQCLLPDDEEYWPQWLKTFCDETGVDPEFVYVVPNDRRAAEENRLPFFERHWPDHRSSDQDAAPRNLKDDLSRLRFGEVKLRSLAGSLHLVLSVEHGAPAYLREVVTASGRFQSAVELLSEDKLARMDHWPTLPNRLLVNEIRGWWQQHREGWARNIHGFYNAVGNGLAWPIRFAREKFGSEEQSPFEEYRRQEWGAILETVEKAYERLQVLADLGNPILRDRLSVLLQGKSRTDLLQELSVHHEQVDLEQTLKDLVLHEMDSFQEESPTTYRMLSRIDKAAAVVRPATSVALFMTGLGPAGDMAAQLVTEPALQAAVQVVGEVTGGTVAVAVGDSAISSGAATGMGYVEAKFRRLHAAFALKRVTWLLELLNQKLWGGLLSELLVAAAVQGSAESAAVDTAIRVLRQQLADLSEPA